MGRAAHHPVGDAERVHDVERQQRDVRRLQDVAAGIEDEVGRLAALVRERRRPLPEPRQHGFVELQARQHLDVLAQPAEALDAAAPALRQRSAAFAMATRAIASMKRGLTP